ncbi:MAG: glycosyltransferase family 2 protein [Bacteroidales bacterium]|nr:glycosyltransferase family 2 protein [Bacteroidales bacterium]
MTISGFTMGKNVSKLYYPIRESIESILPIVDEFVIALGDSDEDDNTEEIIKQINSPKIKIIHTVWDIVKFPNGTENARQTNIAKEACTGDWLLHLQADEVIHEKYLDTIKNACEKYIDNERVEGFLFQYKHFFGDYNHFQNAHGWYPKEIRLIRNKPDIYSFRSAQSFKRVPDFDKKNFRQSHGTFPLNVIELDAYIYHYGWVRPPEYMQKKTKSLDTIHKGKSKVAEIYKEKAPEFDYGNLSKLPVFEGTHPKVMENKIKEFNWADKLHYEKNYKPSRAKMKHEKFKSKLLTFISKKILGGKQLFGYTNWNIIGKEF